ncbi:hypothetical protein C8R43DRAFT_949630 [Mycena crocata]|nr:hypothetical protein C8R43DRAFT_949630 [Mycena crocata]
MHRRPIWCYCSLLLRAFQGFPNAFSLPKRLRTNGKLIAQIVMCTSFRLFPPPAVCGALSGTVGIGLMAAPPNSNLQVKSKAIVEGKTFITNTRRSKDGLLPYWVFASEHAPLKQFFSHN